MTFTSRFLFVSLLLLLATGCSASTKQSPRTPAYEHVQPRRDSGEIFVDHYGYRLSFNTETLCPNWVAWELTRHETQGRLSRYDYFQADPKLPSRYRVDWKDYKGTGWDRGHMCPAADMKWDKQAQKACFYMSNMCPQDGSLNRGAWSKLEEACRRWARREGSVYIVCGPIFAQGGKRRTISRGRKIQVPTGFFKAVLCLNKGREKTIAFYYSNDDKRQTMPQAAMSVDDIERLTGYDLFFQLPDALESRLEASYNYKHWQ